MTGIVNDLTSTFEIVRRLCGDKWKFLIICYLFNQNLAIANTIF